jgi:hypothetical protein
MNIEFERTIDDLIDFNLFHITHSATIKQQRFLSQVLTGVFVAVLIFGFFYLLFGVLDSIFGVFYLRQPGIIYFILIISLLFGAYGFIRFPSINRQQTIRKIEKMLNEENNKEMLGLQVLSLSPEGIFSKSQAGESKVNWSAISRIAQNDKHLFLYLGSVNALVIPKSCFKSEKEQQDFLEYVNTHYQVKM